MVELERRKEPMNEAEQNRKNIAANYEEAV